jgi:hypothetical protein
MTVEEARAKLEQVRKYAGGCDGNAHSERDELWLDILRHLARGGGDAATLAQIGIAAYDIPMCVWFE